jgi:hypothetical protein
MWLCWTFGFTQLWVVFCLWIYWDFGQFLANQLPTVFHMLESISELQVNHKPNWQQHCPMWTWLFPSPICYPINHATFCILIISSMVVYAYIYIFNNSFWVAICRELRRGLHYLHRPKNCIQNVLRWSHPMRQTRRKGSSGICLFARILQTPNNDWHIGCQNYGFDTQYTLLSQVEGLQGNLQKQNTEFHCLLCMWFGRCWYEGVLRGVHCFGALINFQCSPSLVNLGIR